MGARGRTPEIFIWLSSVKEQHEYLTAEETVHDVRSQQLSNALFVKECGVYKLIDLMQRASIEEMHIL